jgi:hypothetical protein
MSRPITISDYRKLRGTTAEYTHGAWCIRLHRIRGEGFYVTYHLPGLPATNLAMQSFASIEEGRAFAVAKIDELCGS